jgi:hypothetical protein
MNDPTDPGPPAWLAGFGGAGIPDLHDRDFAGILLPGLDHEARLTAIRDLLRRHRGATSTLSDEIRELDARLASRMAGLAGRLGTLLALFAYRNRMFHHGLEWPMDERRQFTDRMKAWPAGWFSVAESGGDPWIIYMTDSFVSACVATIEQVIEALGAFIRGLADDRAAERPHATTPPPAE